MQTRRAFLLNSIANLATFTVCGSLVAAGKEKINQKEDIKRSQESGNSQPTSNKPIVNQALDFTLGGILGITAKTLIEKSAKLNRTNKELASTVSKLQKLENDDLPGIEKTLRDFVEKEGIRYEPRNPGNIAESIIGLVDAVLIHINSYTKATTPYLDELKKLRAAFSGPFVEQLQNDSNIDAATREATIQVLKSDKLIEYLATTIVNALESTGAGNKVGISIANSLTGKDLLSNDAIIALKQAVIEVMRSSQVREALDYSVSANITEFDVAERLIKILLSRYKASLQENDPDLIALKDAIAEALKKKDVSEKLGGVYKELS